MQVVGAKSPVLFNGELYGFSIFLSIFPPKGKSYSPPPAILFDGPNHPGEIFYNLSCPYLSLTAVLNFVQQVEPAKCCQEFVFRSSLVV